MPTAVPEVRIGHWTGDGTGCTVVLLPDGTIASGEVRGGAPATREFALLEPTRSVERVDAVVLTGGSAFGLSSADGVVEALADRGVGFPTPGGPVPIVVAMGLYDLTVGRERPTAAAGKAAAEAARSGEVAQGRVGAGTGATVSKWRGLDHARPGGLGIATMSVDGISVSAIIAVNASGDIDGGSTLVDIARGHLDAGTAPPFQNTTIGVVVTDARLTKAECAAVATSAHDGYARAIVPAHTAADGDAVVVAATGRTPGTAPPANHLTVVRLLAVAAVESAIHSAAAGDR